MMDHSIPVIAIDGPTASGKGTIAGRVARELGYNYLDSGAIYRVLAVAALAHGLSPESESDLRKLDALAASLPVEFRADRIYLGGKDVTESIRSEEAGTMASRLAVIPSLRGHLLQRQRDFRRGSGLVADGRDMGSVVFPDAALKVFLTASAQTRAERRHRQLIERGESADLAVILADLQARDKRDTERAVAPLKPCEGAHVLDCSDMSIDEVVNTVKAWYLKA